MVFGLTYWNQVRSLPVKSSLSHRLVTLSMLTVCALGVSMMSTTSLGGILLLIVASLLPWMLAPAPAMTWLIAQNVLLVVVLSNIPDIAFRGAAMAGGLFLGISLFAFMSGLVALRQLTPAMNCAKSIQSCGLPRPCWPRTPVSRNGCVSRVNCMTWSVTI